MPPYTYALASALLWAISVPVLNIGMQRLPQPTSSSVFSGLLVSMTAGTLALGAIAFPLQSVEAVSVATILAGVFTYPIATGLYYLSSFSFNTRTEFAAQFAKMKPLFSMLIAVAILGETITAKQILPVVLMLAGVSFFFLGLLRHQFTAMAFALGLLTALAWAIGEAFVKVGFIGNDTIDFSFVALLAGTSLAWVALPLTRLLGFRPAPLHVAWLWPFALHGIISFGLAYTLFFHSIATLGLYPTVLINAFWPFLSILVAKGTQHLTRQEEQQVPLNIWLASGLLLVASLSEIALLHDGQSAR